MKRTVIVIIIFMLGIGALAYPFVSDHFAKKNGSQMILEYNDKVAELDQETKDKMWAEAEKYNENLTGVPVHDPFMEGTGMAMSTDYSQVLTLNGVMAYIDIPKIDVYLPIFHGTDESVLRRGIGHLEGSTLPIGGKTRHSVITGHSGLVNAKMFTDLTELKENDLFYIHVLGEILAYRVEDIIIIEPQFTDELMRFEDKDYVTLLTCTPYGINSHRLLVRGERTEYNAEEKDAIKPIMVSQADALVFKTAIITTIIMVLIAIIMAVISKKREYNLKLKKKKLELSK